MLERVVLAAAILAVLDPRRDVADRARPGVPDPTVAELRFLSREEHRTVAGE